MKIFFRILVVFGILDVIVAVIEVVSGNSVSSKIILGLVCLAIGIGGLWLLKLRAKS